MPSHCFYFFFFNDTATTEIYTLSLHDALPILSAHKESAEIVILTRVFMKRQSTLYVPAIDELIHLAVRIARSEEHTSELQSQSNLVCRLLLEKKKNNITLTSRKTLPTSHTHPT